VPKKGNPSYPIKEIGGIDTETLAKLRAVRIRTTAGLLKAAKDAKGRKDLFVKTRIPVSEILNLVNQADLMRIKGLGGDYTCLLRGVGVDTLRALRHRNPQHLAKKMAAENAERTKRTARNKSEKPVQLLPSEKAIQKWIERARELPLEITY
jgi:nucleotidyltransferase/DNA polymerase involved in DNA repair